MDEKNNKRKAERFPCDSPAKIAFYVPVEYETCYGPSCFLSTIVDYNENGFGVILENELAANTVVNIFLNRECPSGENNPVDKVYQSKVKWVKTDPKTSFGSYRIGVRHI